MALSSPCGNVVIPSNIVLPVSSSSVIPLIQDATTSQLFSCNVDGAALSGFILRQNKNVETAGVINKYQTFCYVPFDSSEKKLVAFSRDNLVYHVSTNKSDDKVENVMFVECTRNMDDQLNEEDKIHIKSKFSKKKMAEGWVTLGDAIRDIWATVHSTLDINYQKKMLELNKVLCYPDAI